jgi:hypothetical protein
LRSLHGFLRRRGGRRGGEAGEQNSVGGCTHGRSSRRIAASVRTFPDR